MELPLWQPTMIALYTSYELPCGNAAFNGQSYHNICRRQIRNSKLITEKSPSYQTDSMLLYR